MQLTKKSYQTTVCFASVTGDSYHLSDGGNLNLKSCVSSYFLPPFLPTALRGVWKGAFSTCAVFLPFQFM